MKKKHLLLSITLLCILFSMTSCGQKASSNSSSDDTQNLLSGKHHVAIEVNSYGTIEAELDADTAPVTVHLQDAHYKGSAKLGHGVGYLYARDYPNHYVRQQYLPDAYVNEKFYEPGDMGYERDIKKHLDKIKSEA